MQDKAETSPGACFPAVMADRAPHSTGTHHYTTAHCSVWQSAGGNSTRRFNNNIGQITYNAKFYKTVKVCITKY